MRKSQKLKSKWRRGFKWLGIAFGCLVLVIILIMGRGYYDASARLKKVYQVPDEPISLRSDPATLARGKQLYNGVTSCKHCHGEDGGGAIETVIPLLVAVRGPNLTSGHGSVAKAFSDQDFLKAIRHGIRPDGTSLLFMPAETFQNMSQRDVEAVISYVKSLPPVDRVMDPPSLGPIAYFLNGLGISNGISAEKVDHSKRAPASVVQFIKGPEYGKYLVSIGGCRDCHTPQFKGGRIPGTPPSIPPASNLTPAGPLVNWAEKDFLKFFRTGIRPDGTHVHDIMPWRGLGGGTDDEILSVFSYLKTIPPVKTERQ